MTDWADVKSAEMFEAWQDEFELTGDAGHYDGIRTDLAAALCYAFAQGREACAMFVENLDDVSTCPMCPRDMADAIRKADLSPTLPKPIL